MSGRMGLIVSPGGRYSAAVRGGTVAQNLWTTI